MLLEIQHWSSTKLVPYAKNLRKNDKAVDRMVASIQEFGFKIPILARSSGEVVEWASAAQGRTEAWPRGAAGYLV
jgi:hypothetical protein